MRSKRLDIFISYRREGGEHLAGRISDALRFSGFQVFMDVEDLPSGKFNIALFKRIEQATDFIVVMTPGCLDRCNSEQDWLRQEIRCAIERGRNIVPVLARGFQMPTQADLPPDIEEVVGFNGLPIDNNMFDASISKLVKAFL